MRKVCAGFGAELREFNREASHVHLPVNSPPKVALPKLVNSLKDISCRRIRQEFPDLARHYRQANRLRSASYVAGSAEAQPSPLCASTSSSKGGPSDPGRGPSTFTIGPTSPPT